MSSEQPRRFGGAPAWAALLAIAPHVPLLLGTAHLYYEDHARFSTPLLGLAADSICHGRLPVWNPYVGVGIPLLADPQTLALHPASALACVLSPSHALGLIAVLHLALLAAGVALLLRDLGAHVAIAVGVGAALGLCGPAASWTTVITYLLSLAFFPWVLRFALRLSSDGPLAVIGLGLSLALAALGGDVPGAGFQGLAAAGVALATGGRRVIPRLAAAAGLALVVGAVAWAPLLWYLSRSVRSGGIDLASAGRWSTHPAELLGLVIPTPLGLPLPENTFWAFGWFKNPRLFVHSYYVGAVAIGLGVAGVVRFWKEPVIRALGVTALLFLIIASGATTPMWAVLRHLFVFFRYPSKLAPYGITILAVIGGVVASRAARAVARDSDTAIKDDARFGGRTAAAVALLALLLAGVGPLVTASLARDLGAPAEQIAEAGTLLRTDGFRAAVLAALVAAALLLARGGRWPGMRHRLAWVLGAVFLVDGASAGSALWWSIPIPVTTPRPRWLPAAEPWGPRVMRAAELDNAQLHRDEIGYLREVGRLRRLLQPNANVELRVGALEGHGLVLGEPLRAMSALFALDPATLAETVAADVALVPRSPQQAWVKKALDDQRVVVIAALDDGAAVLRPTRALPRAFTATEATIVAEGGEVAALIAGRAHDGPILTANRMLSGGRTLEADVSVFTSALPHHPADFHAVVPETWQPAFVRFVTDRPEPTLLVVADAFVDGWHASVDGHEQPIARANLLGRAVAVPAGRHVVQMWFAEPIHTVAAACTLVGLPMAAGTGLVVVLRGARRRRRAVAAAS